MSLKTHKIFSTVLTIIVYLSSFLETSGTQVKRRYYGYTHVPQDIEVSVTQLDLAHNSITYIDNSSFSLYPMVEEISLKINPVVEIRPGSFYNNYMLQKFSCDNCHITQLPPDFSAATTSLRKLQMKYGLWDTAALGQVHWYTFVKLGHIELWGNVIMEIDTLSFPTSIAILDIARMRLENFPNLSAARFPKLWYLRAHGNNFYQTENIFQGGTNSMKTVILDASNLKSVKGVEALPKLTALHITGNNLETVPNLLGLKSLQKLKIADNARMRCDHRMCWRRLLDRMRTPLQEEDDLKCIMPDILAGHKLSTINPKFMDCANGNYITLFI